MKIYYLMQGGVQNGPYTLDEILRLVLHATDSIWTEGMEYWMPVIEVEELKHKFPPKYIGNLQPLFVPGKIDA